MITRINFDRMDDWVVVKPYLPASASTLEAMLRACSEDFLEIVGPTEGETRRRLRIVQGETNQDLVQIVCPSVIWCCNTRTKTEGHADKLDHGESPLVRLVHYGKLWTRKL